MEISVTKGLLCLASCQGSPDIQAFFILVEVVAAMLLNLQELISSKLPYQDLRICGVYFLFDLKELVYIGSSEDCTTRLRNHEKDKTFDSYFIIEMAPVYIRDVERKYINEFNPWYNKTKRNERINIDQYSGYTHKQKERLQKKI